MPVYVEGLVDGTALIVMPIGGGSCIQAAAIWQGASVR